MTYDPRVIERTLRDEIYAAPDDDGPRSIYADLLIERGDPYGTFIALQLARAQRREPWPSDDEQALLDANWRAWLGEVAIAVGARGIEIERGFLAGVDLGDVRAVPAAVLADRAWGTVRRLAVGRWVEDHLGQLLVATRRSLRSLAVPSERALLVAAAAAPAIDELVLAFDLSMNPPSLAPLGALPALRALGVYCLGELAARWVERADAAGFAELTLVTQPHRDDVRDILRAARRTQIARIAVEIRGATVLHAARDSDGTLAIRSIELRPSWRDPHDALAAAQQWIGDVGHDVDPGVKVMMPVISPALAQHADRLGLKLVRGGTRFGARPTERDLRARS